MCSAQADVRFVPIADIRQSFEQMKTLILKKTASHRGQPHWPDNDFVNRFSNRGG